MDKNNQFIKNSTYRLISKVKWYYDFSKDGEYGFLELNPSMDIYFRGEVVKGILPKNLKEDDIVIADVLITKYDNEQDLRAVSVKLLSDETDLTFLLYCCVILKDQRVFPHTIKQTKESASTLNKADKIKIKEIINIFLDEKSTEIKNYIFLYELCKISGISYLDIIANQVLKLFSNQEKFKFWQVTNANVPFQQIKDQIIENIYTTDDFSCLEKLENEHVEQVLTAIMSKVAEQNTDEHVVKETLIIKEFNEYNLEFDYTLIKDNKILSLWKNRILNFFPLEIIFTTLHNNFLKSIKKNEGSEESSNKEVVNIFRLVSDEELRDLFARAHYNIEVIKENTEVNFLIFLFKHIKNLELKNKLIATVFKKSTDFIKLKWFVLDYTDSLDYQSAVLYTGLLSARDQKLFFKKVLMLIDTKAQELNLEDLNKITTIDYQINEYAKEIDGVGLDFTLSVILKIVNDLKNNKVTQRNDIFEIVASLVKTPNDLLVIDGFFELCDGKTIIKQLTNQQENAPTEYEKKKTEFTPRFSAYCDGRKSLIKDTDQPNLCNKSGFEFWWCENTKCYDVCRTKHKPKDWKHYTLEDVLRILKIDYVERQYEILLNVINRANRFLEHLSCRSCNTILRPKSKSKYAFYGVTIFNCTDDKCEQHQEEIYLSHCLNGKCEDLIDSRDSKKCKSEGYDDKCGWYICNNCLACCSSEKLSSRKYGLEINGLEYKCHTEGHLDRGIICCPDCGNETNTIEGSSEMYNRQLEWFLKHKDNHPNITNSGMRNDGKHWFIWSQNNIPEEEYRDLLKSFLINGFNIPDFNDLDKKSNLIAEPFRLTNQGENIIECSHCNTTKNLGDKNDFDFGRLNAIKSFHRVLFPNYKVNR